MIKLLFAFVVVCLTAACVPSTPQTRIQQDPRRFEALPAKHRSLVEQGKISRGMGKDAVYLAWGRPSGVFQGSKNGRATERWDYAGTRPVYTTNFYGAYGPWYGPHGCRRGYYGYYGFGPEIAYVPYRLASVWFIDERVDSWERAH